jgi:hypothetical protein
MPILLDVRRRCSIFSLVSTPYPNYPVATSCANIYNDITKVDRQLIRLISEATVKWRRTPQPRIPQWLHTKYHLLFDKQSQIGWNQILMGRFSRSWQHTTKKTSQHITQWTTYVITKIWLETYNIWKQRCTTNHGHTADEQQKLGTATLEGKVTALYKQQPVTDHSDKYIFGHSLSEMHAKPPIVIKQWLHKSTLRLKVS